MLMYVATTNAGKLRDFSFAAHHAGEGDRVTAGKEQEQSVIVLEPLPGLATVAAPVEDQDSFEGNARLKAVYYSRQMSGAWVLADDSGLEVDALEGRPGVRSARFAEDLGALNAALGVDGSNNEALLLAMLEQTNRAARYRCVLVLARDGVVVHVSDGSLAGEILSEPEGLGGFGYDPLFFVPEFGGTMAQLSPEQRLACSHRGRAFRALLNQLAGR